MSASVTKTSITQALYEAMHQACCQSTPCKVGSVALGVLLIGIATIMYAPTHASASYATFGCGGAVILTAALVSIIDCTGAIRIPEKKSLHMSLS